MINPNYPTLVVIPALPLVISRAAEINAVQFGDNYRQYSAFAPLTKLELNLKFLNGIDYTNLVNNLEAWQGSTPINYSWDASVPTKLYWIDAWEETPQKIIQNTSYAITNPTSGGGTTGTTGTGGTGTTGSTDPNFSSVILLALGYTPIPGTTGGSTGTAWVPGTTTGGGSTISSVANNLFDVQLSLMEVRQPELWQPPATTPTLNLTPTYSSRIAHKYKFRGGRYRDSTELRSPDGINTRQRAWSLTREALTYIEFIALDNFLYALRGSFPFSWSWLRDSLYTCSQWKFEIQGNNYVNFSAEFMEFFR